MRSVEVTEELIWILKSPHAHASERGERMRGLSLRHCALLAVLISATQTTAVAISTSSSVAPVLRIEASQIQSIPLQASDDSDGLFMFDDSSDDDEDDDDSNDDDIYIAGLIARLRDHQYQQHDRFTLARQWHVFPASGDDDDGNSWFSGDGSFQLELALPGRVFVRALKDDPDYDAERKKLKLKDGDGPGASSLYLAAKVVAMANDSALLNAMSVVEGPQGWSVVSNSQPPTRAVDELVVFVYLDTENGTHLGSIVSKGAGDVVVTKKAMPRHAVAFTASSQGGASTSGVYLLTTSAFQLVSLALEVVGSSSLYLHSSDSVSISNKLAMTVDGSGSIVVKTATFSTAQLTSSVTKSGDICFASSHLSISVLNATVAQNGSISMCSDHASSFAEDLEIDGTGMIDAGAVDSIHTSVIITGGPADVTVGSGISLKYSAPPTSHVWYRGSRPMFVATETSGLLLQKQVSHKSPKCRAVSVPAEPVAVSLIEKGAAAISITTTTTRKPLPQKEKTLSPEEVEALEGSDDPHNLVDTQRPGAQPLIPSSGYTGGAWDHGEAYPMLESSPPRPETPHSKSQESIHTEPSTWRPAPPPPPQEPSRTPSSAPTPSQTPASLAPPSTPIPTIAPTSPDPSPATGEAPTKVATFTDIILMAGVCFIAFSWLLHYALRCCDQRNRRRYYQSINSDRPGPTTAHSDSEGPPVFI